jgi:hypothetical protein
MNVWGFVRMHQIGLVLFPISHGRSVRPRDTQRNLKFRTFCSFQSLGFSEDPSRKKVREEVTQQPKLELKELYFQRGSLLCRAVSVGHSKKVHPLSSLCNYDGTRAAGCVCDTRFKKNCIFHTLSCSVWVFVQGFPFEANPDVRVF